MEKEDFTIIRQVQRAADYGKQYFNNGAATQVEYKVFDSYNMLGSIISTKTT